MDSTVDSQSYSRQRLTGVMTYCIFGSLFSARAALWTKRSYNTRRQCSILCNRHQTRVWRPYVPRCGFENPLAKWKRDRHQIEQPPRLDGNGKGATAGYDTAVVFFCKQIRILRGWRPKSASTPPPQYRHLRKLFVCVGQYLPSPVVQFTIHSQVSQW